MSFIDYLNEYAGRIELDLEDIFKDWRGEVTKLAPKTLPFLEEAIQASSGGKRVRGVLVNLGYQLVSGKTDINSIRAGSAYEIFQTAILSHDDIMDQSPLRRGKPTIYQALGGDHYGISQTISLGDIGFFQTMNILSGLKISPERKSRAIQNFTANMTDTAFGQLLDVSFEHEHIVSEEDILLMAKLKTSRYTITGPLTLGADLAGANSEMVQNIQTFGDNVGIAFQIQDDILGVFGSEKEIGKSVTSDVTEGKKTVLLTYALKMADKRQLEIINNLYGKKDITAEELEVIRQIFQSTGALANAKKLAQEFASIGKKAISRISEDLNYQDLLGELADFMVDRKT